ncbi:MAG: cyclic nucleotide-binding domain-containing protein [Deltaproteobacteria bacterium]|nr:cyclic nucleotide-binding domain-containing protein [Deltaproteobacteria bacterium]
MSVTVEHLTRATQRLREHPHDQGGWLELAAIHHALGNTEDAELVFATIGEGARVGGQVALAVACGRHLAELGSVRGPELIDHVVETYAKDGTHVATAASSGAPAPPEETPSVPAGKGSAVEEARAAVATLGAWLTARKVANIPAAPLLSALSKPGARALVGVMTARAFAAGAVVIDVGQPATALYWIAHGTLGVERNGAQLGELHTGEFFGEIALMGGTLRTARVTAREDVWVLEIPARAIENAAQKHPKLAEVLANHARTRLLANLMRTSELFRALEDDDRDALLARFEIELVPAGQTFIHEGKGNGHLWVLVSGKCQVQSAGAPLADLGPGAAVGEISLVSGTNAVASVTAIEPAVLLRLSKGDFKAVVKRHPKLLAEVEKLVVARETANRALFQDAADLIV